MVTVNRAAMFCVCGHSHDVHNMSTGGSTSCNTGGCSCARWGLDDISGRREALPVIDERTAALVALFEAALAAKAGALDLHEPLCPGAGATLIAWARSRGLRIDERHYVVSYSAPYANVRVMLGDSALHAITVLGYRALTPDEIAAITVETRERQPERIGYGEAVL